MRAFVDGVAVETPHVSIPITDRAFQYGDGLFETMWADDGRVRFLDDHLDRLENGCARLGFPMPERPLLGDEIERAARGVSPVVVKLIVSRGDGPRGYRPPADPRIRRVLTIHAAPPPPTGVPITACWCATALARNPALAGLKHLNRLEQVLAQAEWSDPDIAEGLMLDTEGELICGTASNVFVCIDGTLCTPDLRFCGVAGVMRRRVIAAARDLRVSVSEGPLRPDDLERASEVFVTNAVTGIRPLGRLGHRTWRAGPVVRSLAHALELW